MMYVKISAAIACAAALSGCVPSQSYESAPVQVQTSQGVVTCQLYTKDIVLWDRALSHPTEISAQAADQVCTDEGKRRKNAG